MELKINDLITLSDKNEYVVVSTANYSNKKYYYIADINDNSNLKFCYIENDELIVIKDSNLILSLLPLFNNSLYKEGDD